jgi:serine/threonine protein kinase
MEQLPDGCTPCASQPDPLRLECQQQGSSVATTSVKIGRYTVVGHLGRGGYASVYKACLPGQTKQQYAIKVSHEHLPDEEAEQGVQNNQLMAEWCIYRTLDYGREDANWNGIPRVYETGESCSLLWLAGWLAGWLPIVCSPVGLVKLERGAHPYLVMQLLGR